MAPILWETLSIYSGSATSEKLATLLQPDNGVLKNVRHISIKRFSSVGASDRTPTIKAIVQLLFGALPKNGLVGFESCKDISVLSLLHLLQCHQNLSTLDARIDPTSYGSPLYFDAGVHATWIAQALTGLHKLTVYLESENRDTYKSSAMLIRSSPQLKALTVQGYKGTPPLTCSLGELNALSSNANATRLQLSHLALISLKLGLQPTVLTNVDSSSLRSLRIYKCRNVKNLLTPLTTLFAQTCGIDELEIDLGSKLNNANSDVQAMEALLKSFTGLKHLWLDVGEGPMIDVSCICRHGSTLCQLGVASRATTSQHLTSMDLSTIIASCTNLSGLAIDFCPIDLGQIKNFGSEFGLQRLVNVDHAATQLETYLVC